MAASQKETRKRFTPPESNRTKIDLTAPAGSAKSLGAMSVRDERPATCDDVVEAMDEVGPGIPTP
jgi:hypothetical protein